MSNTCFDRGKIKNHYIKYPYRLKFKFTTYNREMESFCNEHFGCNWSVRYYNEKYRPLSVGREVFYIIGFTNEEDAVLFKMNYNFASPLTEDETRWDNNQ